jgi:hypothetical protein
MQIVFLGVYLLTRSTAKAPASADHNKLEASKLVYVTFEDESQHGGEADTDKIKSASLPGQLVAFRVQCLASMCGI